MVAAAAGRAGARAGGQPGSRVTNRIGTLREGGDRGPAHSKGCKMMLKRERRQKASAI